jgi:hypothetical protein
MGSISKVTPGSPMVIKATEWNAVADLVNVGVNQSVPGTGIQQSISVLVRNDTGEDLDRYDTIALGEPIFTLQADGSVDLIFIGVKADPAKPVAICIEPIAHDATNKRFGQAWIHGLAYAFVAAGSTSATTGNPTASGNILTPGSGPVRLLGAPHASETRLLPVLLGAGGGGGENILAVTPVGGIPAMTGTTLPLTFTSAICHRIDPSTGNYYSPNQTIEIFNMVNVVINGQTLIQAKPFGDKPFVDVDNCGTGGIALPITASPGGGPA